MTRKTTILAALAAVAVAGCLFVLPQAEHTSATWLSRRTATAQASAIKLDITGLTCSPGYVSGGGTSYHPLELRWQAPPGIKATDLEYTVTFNRTSGLISPVTAVIKTGNQTRLTIGRDSADDLKATNGYRITVRARHGHSGWTSQSESNAVNTKLRAEWLAGQHNDGWTCT